MKDIENHIFGAAKLIFTSFLSSALIAF